MSQDTGRINAHGRSFGAHLILLCLLLALAAGCTRYQPVASSSRGGVAVSGEGRHIVRSGETLGTIAAAYGVSWRSVAAANDLADPDRILAGQVLTIPRGGAAVAASRTGRRRQTAPVEVAEAAPARPRPTASRPPSPKPELAEDERTAPATPAPARDVIGAIAGAPTDLLLGSDPLPAGEETARSAAADPARSTKPAQPATRREPRRPMPPAAIPAAARPDGEAGTPPLSGDGFLWPVAGEVIDGFGSKPNGQRNDGINIAAAAGSAVVAAEHGVVAFAGDSIAGYGNMLLIRHADGFTTAYAHADRLEVRVGEVVRRGQVVARVGRTGAVELPQLHFELRAGKRALDPAPQLVGRSSLVARSAAS